MLTPFHLKLDHYHQHAKMLWKISHMEIFILFLGFNFTVYNSLGLGVNVLVLEILKNFY